MIDIKEEIRDYLEKEGKFKDLKRYNFEFNYHLSTIERSKKVLDFIRYFVNLKLKNKKVLDAGCGSGGISIVCAKGGADCTGIDLNKKRIELAKKFAKYEKVNINFVDGDLKKQFIDSNSFDIIIAIDFIEHVNSEEMIKILMTYLKKDGRFIFKLNNGLFPYEPHIKNILIHFLPIKIIDYYLKIFYKDFFKHYNSYEEINLPTYFELKKILKNFDFQIYPTFYPFFPNRRLPRILNKFFSNKLMNLFCQSWIVICVYKNSKYL